MKHFQIPGLLFITAILLYSCKKGDAGNTPITPSLQLPSVTTSDISSITQKTAVCGGAVTNDGGAAVTARGICWSTKKDPTTADNLFTNGTGVGSYTSSLAGLTSTAFYYVRAYATNSVGTAYGNTVTFSALEIGQQYQGGTIAYILMPGDPGYTAGAAHGFIASPATSNGFQWYPSTIYTTTGARSTALGSGYTNTTLIVATLAPGIYSASYCFTQKIGIYDDWYLPSKDELNKLYLSKDKISSLPPSGYFWTSSEISNSGVWIQSFSTGVQSTYDKNGSGFWTWAIRSF